MAEHNLFKPKTKDLKVKLMYEFPGQQTRRQGHQYFCFFFFFFFFFFQGGHKPKNFHFLHEIKIVASFLKIQGRLGPHAPLASGLSIVWISYFH